MGEHAVLIVGAGPTGLMLAAELALAKIDVAILERRAGHDLTGLRAGGLHMRTLELLDQRGVAERFIPQGQKHRMAPFLGAFVDASDLPTRHNYTLGLRQPHIERILAEWVRELGVAILHACEVTDLAQDGSGVDVSLADRRSMRAQYLIGCDGGRSIIRKKAGIEFPGTEASTSYLIAEIETAQEPAWGFRRSAKGNNAIGKIDDGKRAGIVLNEGRVVQGDAPMLADVRDTLIAVYGTDFGLRRADYVSRFTDMARQAAAYRDRRVLLAGDAAHVHSPHGGQGLNLGMQDAVNLGWKLASVVSGAAPPTLLDSYHGERHPAGARVLRNTLALATIDRSDDRMDALRAMVAELTQGQESRQRFVAMQAGLDVRYELGAAGKEGAHPLLGRRMPDLELDTPGGARRVFTLLHTARPVFIGFGEAGRFDVSPWADRVQRVDASYTGSWELPVLGAVPAPAAVLIRPDGHVAWAGEASAAGLADALTTWFGPPRP